VQIVSDCRFPLGQALMCQGQQREQPVGFAKPARIDGTELLDQDPRPLTVDFHFRPRPVGVDSRGHPTALA
jgi:hypothetical protein